MSTATQIDPTVYPETDYMGEGELQQLINELLRPLLARFLGSRGVVAHVGSNTFLYYVKHDSSARIAPDIYVLPGIAQSVISRSWRLFDLGLAPSFALEVVSTNRDKDYAEAPGTHAVIGTRELVIFDPAARGRKDRFVWQRYRRAGGAFVAERSNADRIRSLELGSFLRVVGRGDAQRLRLGVGARGDELVPTEAEAERADKDRAAAERDRERVEKDRERAEKDHAVAERDRERAEKDHAVAERDRARADADAAVAALESERAAREQLEAKLAAVMGRASPKRRPPARR